MKEEFINILRLYEFEVFISTSSQMMILSFSMPLQKYLKWKFLHKAGWSDCSKRMTLTQWILKQHARPETSWATWKRLSSVNFSDEFGISCTRWQKSQDNASLGHVHVRSCILNWVEASLQSTFHHKALASQFPIQSFAPVCFIKVNIACLITICLTSSYKEAWRPFIIYPILNLVLSNSLFSYANEYYT